MHDHHRAITSGQPPDVLCSKLLLGLPMRELPGREWAGAVLLKVRHDLSYWYGCMDGRCGEPRLSVDDAPSVQRELRVLEQLLDAHVPAAACPGLRAAWQKTRALLLQCREDLDRWQSFNG